MKNRSVKFLEEVFLIILLIAIIARFFAARGGYTDTVDLLSWISFVLVLGLIGLKVIYKLFPKGVGNKPTMEEIEKRQFGKDSKN